MENYYKIVEAMLYNYKKNKAEIKNILIEISEIENGYRGIGAIIYDNMPRSNNVSSSIENEIESKEKRIEYLNILILRKENEIKKIDNAIETLNEREKEIITLFYIDRKTNKDIACRVDLTEQRICKIKNISIKKIIDLTFH